MAYDLIYGKIDKDVSRTKAATATTVVGGIGLIASIVMLLVPRARRRAEIVRYRREFAPGHRPTIEMPVVPMATVITRPWSPLEEP